jgi:iron-sulfur cluster repair protein YtfE (RIC family)
MASLKALREEHNALLPHVEQLRDLADGVGRMSADELADGVDAAHGFLAGHLLPHAAAEEANLYPVVSRVMGAPQATATMSRDHVEVGRLTEELAGLRDHLSTHGYSSIDANALRRVLYGLYELVTVHFAKEEEVYVPLLEQELSDQDAHQMLHAMGHAAHA